MRVIVVRAASRSGPRAVSGSVGAFRASLAHRGAAEIRAAGSPGCGALASPTLNAGESMRIRLIGLAVSGCGAKKEASSGAAIDYAKTLETTQQQVDYLVGQAKAFYNSKEFQGAVDIAQYILAYLDADNAQAEDLLNKAKEQLQAAAQGVMDEAQKGISGFGK